MKRFAFTLVVLAILPAAGLAAQPDSETIAAERQIRQKLNEPAEIEFVATPLRDVVQNLKTGSKSTSGSTCPRSRKWASTNRRP